MNAPREGRAQLERLGVHVTACVAHVAPANEHNRLYLRTTAVRRGHHLDEVAEP